MSPETLKVQKETLPIEEGLFLVFYELVRGMSNKQSFRIFLCLFLDAKTFLAKKRRQEASPLPRPVNYG